MAGPKFRVDPKLKEWASPYQVRLVDAINEHRSLRKAAQALGTHNSVVGRSLKALERRAAMYGYSPQHDMSRTVPEPFIVKGVSTYYNKEGKAAGQWVKSRIDDERREEMVRAAVEALMQEVERSAPIAPPGQTASTLCNLITLTDCHVGMRAWSKETGADWDLSIAEATLIGAVRHLIAASPSADTCLVSQLGDFLHFDGPAPVTPTHGHILDADSRLSKIVGAAVRILRVVIDMALARHQRVVVLMSEGNHDIASSVWLRHMFKLLYEQEPRVEVIDSELPYYVHQHGQTMLAFHHGHLKKNDQLPLLFAAQFPTIWGSTTKRYAHTGHRHHVEEREHSGMVVIQHPTIAARDAYAARGGWIAERQISSITYHDRFGQVARNTVTPEMLG